ncbi:MAG TPA: two-component regulator propeller domain-containing protein [Blastocatellia bacterium]|nr:two-component regulator propeller domain-containing protein [Blastocatellia bacterium]
MLVASAIALPASDKSESTPSNLHQWGAVTLFHGLPSDHVRTIAQSSDGAMWLGTDGGLARYDCRRIQKIATEGIAASRILALKLDDTGALWIGSDAGAASTPKRARRRQVAGLQIFARAQASLKRKPVGTSARKAEPSSYCANARRLRTML